MRTLYFDCFSGISGDMTVGALRALGVDESVFLDALATLKLGDEFHAHFHEGSRQNVAGWKFDVHAHSHADGHHHLHEHSHGNVDEHSHFHVHKPGEEEHVHGRSFRQIRRLIEDSELSDFIKKRAVAVFHRVAVAEGKIHGMPAEEVTFHEVGAVDSIADIVAACAGLEALQVERIAASKLVEATGWVDCAHGRFPLPAPATLEILTGIPLRQIEEEKELITPTGAALLAEFATSFGPMPEIKVEKVGYGLGTRNSAPRPNVLRVVLGESSSNGESDEVTQIETNLDDLSPELAGAAMERLLAAGALDVFFSAAQMKKNRPGLLLCVICAPEKAEELARVILTETSAFGVRMHQVRRMKLRREIHEIETPYGPVEVKYGYLGSKLVQTAPEYESCAALAKAKGISVREVYQAATAMALKG